MAEKDALLIGELAELAGVTPETIRYYERERVIPVATRSGGGKYRHYDRDDADRLRFVKRARDLGFSLDSVRELLTLAEGDSSKPCGDVDEIARTHIADIDEKLARLKALRRELTRLTSDCNPNGRIAECRLLTALNR